MDLEYIEKIEESGTTESYVIHRLISRNETLDCLKSTDEEKLLELVDELRLVFVDELAKVTDRTEDYRTNFPRFYRATKEKSELCKNDAGYRKLLCVPMFTVGLVMVARIRRHYTHAPWFRVPKFQKMLDIHGTVRRSEGYIRDGEN
jgi:hypothetical protein